MINLNTAAHTNITNCNECWLGMSIPTQVSLEGIFSSRDLTIKATCMQILEVQSSSKKCFQNSRYDVAIILFFILPAQSAHSLLIIYLAGGLGVEEDDDLADELLVGFEEGVAGIKISIFYDVTCAPTNGKNDWYS